LLHLVADIAHQIGNLRKLLSDHGITAGAINCLDKVVPSWRSDLPIPTGDEAARQLVEGLVHARARSAVIPVDCRRLLIRRGDGWSFGARLQIEGSIEDDDLPPDVRASLASFTRARILTTGELARRGYSALGVASRQGDDDGAGWEVRSFFGSSPLEIDDFPVSADVRLLLAAGSFAPAEFVPSGGARVTSNLMVFKGEGREDDENRLVLAATGSVRDTAPRLYVVVSEQAAIRLAQGGSVTRAGAVDGRSVLSIEGVAEIEISGDRYRVVSGADSADAARIEAIGSTMNAFQTNRPAYRGCPAFIVHRGVLKSRGEHGALRMRGVGQREPWRPFSPRALPLGPVEVGLYERDICLDRIDFIHLPVDAQVNLNIPSPSSCRIAFASFGCSSIEPLHGEGVGQTRAGGAVSFDVSAGGAQRRPLRLRVRWGEREMILAVPVLSQRVGFYDSQGAALPSNRQTSLPSLVGASAEAVEKSSVLIGFRAPAAGLRGHHIERTFERSLPFSQVRDDVGRLFAMSDDLDAEVKVEALHAGVAASTLFRSAV
jgi:hypothetical protein